ncbi:MAG: hypothetical protein FJ104_03390 [Deltaproteobacteria bacterium]|nr:hypothetical protein [Deltaproteobacteria bacterium]
MSPGRPRVRTAAARTLPLALLALAWDAHAGDVNLPGDDLGVGVSVAHAWVPQGGSAFVHGVDAAYLIERLAWVGGGVRVVEVPAPLGREVLPYLEGGVALLFLTLGGGYTLDADGARPALGGPHLYAGLALPLLRSLDLYVAPHYRLTFAPDDRMHELGLALKWTTWDMQR